MQPFLWPAYHQLYGYRESIDSDIVHIASRLSLRSLCGRKRPEVGVRPLAENTICWGCRQRLYALGLLPEGG